MRTLACMKTVSSRISPASGEEGLKMENEGTSLYHNNIPCFKQGFIVVVWTRKSSGSSTISASPPASKITSPVWPNLAAIFLLVFVCCQFWLLWQSSKKQQNRANLSSGRKCAPVFSHAITSEINASSHPIQTCQGLIFQFVSLETRPLYAQLLFSYSSFWIKEGDERQSTQ